MNVIQKMLRNYYEIIEYDIKPRPVVMENIEKVINCRDPSYGGAMYGCTHCGNLKIDSSLRHFFLDDRDLLSCLFDSVSDVIKALFFSLNRSKNFVPGFICVLHTFGRPLE